MIARSGTRVTSPVALTSSRVPVNRLAPAVDGLRQRPRRESPRRRSASAVKMVFFIVHSNQKPKAIARKLRASAMAPIAERCCTA